MLWIGSCQGAEIIFLSLVCEEGNPEQVEAVIGEETASLVLARMGGCVVIVGPHLDHVHVLSWLRHEHRVVRVLS